jgi:hypothetical protein
MLFYRCGPEESRRMSVLFSVLRETRLAEFEAYPAVDKREGPQTREELSRANPWCVEWKWGCFNKREWAAGSTARMRRFVYRTPHLSFKPPPCPRWAQRRVSMEGWFAANNNTTFGRGRHHSFVKMARCFA